MPRTAKDRLITTQGSMSVVRTQYEVHRIVPEEAASSQLHPDPLCSSFTYDGGLILICLAGKRLLPALEHVAVQLMIRDKRVSSEDVRHPHVG